MSGWGSNTTGSGWLTAILSMAAGFCLFRLGKHAAWVMLESCNNEVSTSILGIAFLVAVAVVWWVGSARR